MTRAAALRNIASEMPPNTPKWLRACQLNGRKKTSASTAVINLEDSTDDIAGSSNVRRTMYSQQVYKPFRANGFARWTSIPRAFTLFQF